MIQGQDLLTRSVLKKLIRFAFPLFLTNLLQGPLQCDGYDGDICGFPGQEHKHNRFDAFRGRNRASITGSSLKPHVPIPPYIRPLSASKFFKHTGLES